jgi:uncharacterized membrane protein (DUF4010 family)
MGFTNYLKGMHEDSTTMKTSLIGGVRTFFLLSISGMVSGALYTTGNIGYSFILSISVILLILSFFIVTAAHNENASFSDELSAIMAHFLSFIWVTNTVPTQILVAVFVATIFILEQREFLVSLKDKVNVKEFSQIVVFLVIVLIILPFLPNTNFALKDMGIDPAIFGITNGSVAKLAVLGLFNPYKLWFFVVFVSGLDIIGYLLKKALSGSTSTLLSAMIGGFISSTSTTIGLAQKSKKEKDTHQLVAGALLANVVSFLQITVLIAPISLGLLRLILPFLFTLMLTGSIVAFYLLQNGKQLKKSATAAKSEIIPEPSEDDSQIFRLAPAIKFAVLLTTVKIVASISLELIGSSGFIVTALIASFTGIDAITITLAELFNKASVNVSMATTVFILINVVNLGSKILYSYLSGSKAFFKQFSISISVILIIATAVQLLIK